MAAASEFVTARTELLKLEMRDAGQLAAKRAALVVVILFGAFFFWMFAVAGLIGWVSASQSWPWHGVALGAAFLHLLLAAAAGMLLKKPAPPSFPITRAEIAKDQAWLETLKNDRKSPN